MTKAAEIGLAWAGRLGLGRYVREGLAAAAVTGRFGVGHEPDVARLVAAAMGGVAAGPRPKPAARTEVAREAGEAGPDGALADMGGRGAAAAPEAAPGRERGVGAAVCAVQADRNVAAPRLRLTMLEGAPNGLEGATEAVAPGGGGFVGGRPGPAPGAWQALAAPVEGRGGLAPGVGRAAAAGQVVVRLAAQARQHGARGAMANVARVEPGRGPGPAGTMAGFAARPRPVVPPPQDGDAGAARGDAGGQGWSGGTGGAAVDSGRTAPQAGADGAGASAPTQGDVYLDGTLMGRWVARSLAADAGRPASGGTAFDPRRNAFPAGAMIGG